MIVETLSTFPTMYQSVMGSSMMQRAQDAGLLDFTAYDLRDWTFDRHRTTDDSPYGGGAGLVMKCEPIFLAVDDIAGPSLGLADGGIALGGEGAPSGVAPSAPRVHSAAANVPACPPTGPAPRHRDAVRPTIVFMAPQGRTFDDALASELAEEERLLFVCGHYEGIDERAYQLADRIISLGDYVLTSGELASMVVIDAVVRKIPGVLGADGGAEDESFVQGLLEYPQYTRPSTFRGMEVPPVLLSGNHQAVDRWRRQQSLARTAAWRPDLLESAPLEPEDRVFLESLPKLGR